MKVIVNLVVDGGELLNREKQCGREVLAARVGVWQARPALIGGVAKLASTFLSLAAWHSHRY